MEFEKCMGNKQPWPYTSPGRPWRSMNENGDEFIYYDRLEVDVKKFLINVTEVLGISFVLNDTMVAFDSPFAFGKEQNN